jgi:protein TonB
MSTAATFYLDAHAVAESPLRRYRGAAVSVLLHGAALAAVWSFSGAVVQAPLVLRTVELIRLKDAVKLAPPPEPPKAVKPVALVPPRATTPPPATAQAQPKTVAADAAHAEIPTPPAPPPAAPVGPVTPAVPVAAQPAPSAPPPAPARKVIATEGIPSDYVNQVYQRINRNADYPREARLRRQQGRVAYRLTLSQAGALLAFDIDTSGSDILDQAAKEAIQRAAPFPPLPELGGSSYLLAGNIVFKIN